MARDHALAELLASGTGVLRLYAWRPWAISFGRNEPTAGRYDRDAAAREGLTFVRRPTGGRALLHAEEITYAVALPARALGGVREAYHRINQGLVEGVRALGAPAELAAGGAAVLPPDAGPCFRVPAPGEVVAGGRKLVASAQVRLGAALLQHGSIILRGDQSAVTRLGGGAPAETPASIEALVGAGVDPADVATAVAGSLRLALGGHWAEGGYLPGELDRADELETTRYATQSWTWRR